MIERPPSWALALPGVVIQRDGADKDRRDKAYESLLAMAQDADAGRVASVARIQLAATLRDLVRAVHRGDDERTMEIVEEAERLLSLERRP